MVTMRPREPPVALGRIPAAAALSIAALSAADVIVGWSCCVLVFPLARDFYSASSGRMNARVAGRLSDNPRTPSWLEFDARVDQCLPLLGVQFVLACLRGRQCRDGRVIGGDVLMVPALPGFLHDLAASYALIWGQWWTADPLSFDRSRHHRETR